MAHVLEGAAARVLHIDGGSYSMRAHRERTADLRKAVAATNRDQPQPRHPDPGNFGEQL